MQNFIVFEGIDGAGTTTQARRLYQTLAKRGVDCFLTCQPSTGPVGKLLREQLADPDGIRGRGLALLFAADRNMHIETFRERHTVVCDRYVLSSWAYQGIDQDLDWIRTINADVPIPNLTILIDVDPRVAELRRRDRGNVRDLFEVPETQRILAARYRELIHAWPGPTAVVDGSGDVDQVAEAVHGAVFQGSRPPTVGQTAEGA
jgi:dTMP kinase